MVFLSTLCYVFIVLWYLREDNKAYEPANQSATSNDEKLQSMLPDVTIYFLVTQNDWWRVPLHIPHLIRTSMYPFAKIIVYVDSDILPSSSSINNNPLPPDSQLARELNKLKGEGWISEIRLVEMNRTRYDRILSSVFDSKDSISPMLIYSDVGQRRGFLSYIQGLEECDTQYCAHFDIGTPPSLSCS